MEHTPAVKALLSLFFPYANRREERFRKRKMLLSHYTTAEVGAQILLKRDVWMRNASSMNDYSEVAFGRACLKVGLESHGERLRNAFEQARPGAFDAVMRQLKQEDFNRHQHTYLTCLTEHRPNDDLGKLSMWRAYGGSRAGVALVFKPDFLNLDTNELAAWSSPVLYGDGPFQTEFEALISGLEQNVPTLQGVDENVLRSVTFNAMQFAILSSKHEGFREEREWRIIHSPREYASAWVLPTFEAVNGKPEVVYHLPLQAPNGLDLPGLELTNLLDRIIIGPCQNPIQIASTYVDILQSLGFSNPDSYVRISNIPLRQLH